ncbi:hypothetical protein jhhlp_001268 [Lomentospora prolificans]|uniref:3-beta hydroxysteroid dehydrogenase/isomerase domain-containing protein n=1 Tax=Lomentospora prolificans TaxID=41688 RepID=A0A2N3NHZ2_9PEZI|nr:hypothetical protein jhhlp_001268 [Lomentospora prolificans]
MQQKPLLDSVLVTGGCGFLGYAVVKALLADPECGRIYVVDRAAGTRNRHEGVHYTQGSIADQALMERVFSEAKPVAVLNLASPNFSFPTGRRDFFETNVRGTEVLLRVAEACPSVRAFVHCSSVDIYKGPPHVMVDEAHPTCVDYHEAYARTKALADAIVLAADGPDLSTACMRLSHMYGARCSQQLQILMDMCAGSRPLFQLGPGKNKVSVISVDNAAAAHMLAAKALVDPARARGKVAGEAFNITDGEPKLFWPHAALFWSAARGRSVDDELIRVPAWLARLLIGLVQWLFYIFTLGTVEPPPSASSTALTFALEDHTYSYTKAKERLGFEPVSNHDEVIRASVVEELKRRAEEKAKK